MRRFVLLLAAPLLVGAAWPVAQCTATNASRAASCGEEHSNVKTLADRRRLWVHLHALQPTTVRALRHKQPPSPTGRDTPRRRGVETTVYRVRARLVEMKLEDDSDTDLVIQRLHAPAR